jgi:sugar-specific transcriptional regulator TrmB
MVKNLEHVLQSIGFQEAEAQLYITGLQLGSAPASDYAKATGLNRITSYNLLEAMVHVGRFTMVKKV